MNGRPCNVLHSQSLGGRVLDPCLHTDQRRHDAKWNQSGSRPHRCDILQRIAVLLDPDVVVWRGSDVPTVQFLGRLFGHHDFVQNFLERVADEHQQFLDLFPAVPNLQSSWLLLLHCASARANCLLRTLCPDSVQGFAEAHDRGLWECVCALLNIPVLQEWSIRDTATLLLSLGGLGLRRVLRTSPSVHWASWADSLPMIRARHPVVADMIIRELEGHPVTPCLRGASARPHTRQRILNQAGSVKGGNMRQFLSQATSK